MAIDSGLTFGEWLRQRRRAIDLTRAELAARVGCSVSALRKFEADDLRPSRPLAEALAGALQIALEDRAAFVRFARAMPSDDTPYAPVPTVDLPHPVPPTRVRPSLPTPPTALIGRAPEIVPLYEAPERAARLWGAAEQLRQAIGCRPAPAARTTYERALGMARNQLDDAAAFAAAWAAGQALTLEQVVVYALEETLDQMKAVHSAA